MSVKNSIVTKKNNPPKTSTGNDPFELLEVIDRLEVGPIRLESNRLVAPYRLFQNGGQDETELIYRYEEKVFEPDEPESLNLANMIAAQVAMNYGLFCKRIVFHGLFHESDQKFIEEMTENTCREIYVKKFLEPNPFLLGEAAEFPVVKKARYLRAELEFPKDSYRGAKPKWRLWSSDKSKHAVLSSGGKDSLLSFGLLKELKREVHPIFINESGRHWFTAVNAFRYFQKNIPNTARVWTNSDRVFAWMLRHMPFIRPDFADIRSDEYAIRLWTVAVFLFGALPLLRKRGIGRLLIGDEFDTSERKSFKGIPHYNGLYDQSRYFDNALSRYYLRKGWQISQFSIIRQLSEMLIEKILVGRYPKLQQQQMSCHATHKDGERVKPCGKCEKCRRIVGMLLAVGADPRKCGYTKEQIQDCLIDLADKGVHQESAGAEQLLFLLNKNGILPKGSPTKKIKEHPEILQLRFEMERAPMNGIPHDLRKPLYKILLRHTDGALRRMGRRWVELDLLSDPSLHEPYPFEVDSGGDKNQQERKSKSLKGHPYLWSQLTWPEAEQRFNEVDIALLPVGAIEQHGPHLPLDTDAFDANYLAQKVAEACSEPKPLVLPVIPYGVSYHHDEFKGTISISNETLSHLVYEIGMNVAHNGIKKLVIINGHGGNGPALNFAAQRINEDGHIFICVDTGETSDVDIYEIADTPNDVHAGEIETSTSLAVRPHLVKMERASKLIPQFSSRYLNFTSKRGVSWYAYTKRISQNGVMGDPTNASAEKGRKMWKIMIAHLVALVEDLKRMTLEEVYQRRY